MKVEVGVRQIEISTDVFARIWALRKNGEDSENAILERILSEKTKLKVEAKERNAGGISVPRFAVYFPEGFKIERNYCDKNYYAVVKGGKWHLDGDDAQYSSLNELSGAIGTKIENAWVNWFYRGENGERCPVSDLRDPNTINTKGKSKKKSGGRALGNEEDSMTWYDDVEQALKNLGGEAHLSSIYIEVEKIRKDAGRSVPTSLEATIRRTLEDHSSDSENFRGQDLFRIVRNKGDGEWALRKKMKR